MPISDATNYVYQSESNPSLFWYTPEEVEAYRLANPGTTDTDFLELVPVETWLASAEPIPHAY